MAYKFISVGEKFDIEENFWERNGQIRFIEPFKKLYDRDTTENKKASSKEMFCIYLYCDPSYTNKIGKLPEVEKKSAILSYYEEFDFEDPVIQQCITEYDTKCLSEAAQKFKRTLNSIELYQRLVDKKIDEGLTLDTLVQVGPNRWVNSKGTANQIVDLKKKVTQVWFEYEKISKLFEEEQGNIVLYGGGKPTVMEEGGLVLLDDED